MTSPAISSPNGDGSSRFTWPEVAVLVIVLAFDGFLIWWGLTPQTATFIAVSATAAVLALLVVPRRLTEFVKLLRTISGLGNQSGPGGASS
jgi:hypothetical protein